MQRIIKYKKTIVVLSALVLFLLSILEGQKKTAPVQMSLSYQEIDPADKTAWRWLLGKKGWMPIPDKTRSIQIDMKANRGNLKDPLEVTLTVAGGSAALLTFPSTFYHQSATITVNPDISGNRLVFSCTSTWSPAHFKDFMRDNRKLCIYARIIFKQ